MIKVMTSIIVLFMLGNLWAAEEKLIDVSLLVFHDERAQTKIKELAENHSGILVSQRSGYIEVILPIKSAEQFNDSIQTYFKVTKREETQTGLNSLYKNKVTEIQTKEDLLEQYFEILNKASEKGFVEIEKAIQSLVTEIELLKNELAKIVWKGQWVQYSLRTLVENKQLNSNQLHSPFNWINDLDINYLMESIQ